MTGETLQSDNPDSTLRSQLSTRRLSLSDNTLTLLHSIQILLTPSSSSSSPTLSLSLFSLLVNYYSDVTGGGAVGRQVTTEIQ